MELVEHVTEMLEVPGHFQKPHQIFILEKADWSFENNTLEETDPLCLEEQDCENTTEGEEQPPLQLPVKVDLIIKEEAVELVGPSLPPSELTVRKEKVPGRADCAKRDKVELFDPSLPLLELTVRKEKVPGGADCAKRDKVELFDPSLPLSELTVEQDKKHHSTTVASPSIGNTPLYKRPAGIVIVKAELLQPRRPFKGRTGDSRLEKTGRRAGATSASPLRNGHSTECCVGYTRKWVPYSQIIATAILNSPNRWLSLSEICLYARRKFPTTTWYRESWQTSISHMLYVSPLFVKMQRTAHGKGHYWALEPSFLDTAQKHFTEARQCCCQWKLVCRLHRLRQQEELPSKSPVCRRRTKTSSYTLKNNRFFRSSFRGDTQGGIPLASNLKKPEIPKLPSAGNNSETDTEDEFDCNEEVVGPEPPLRPLIARAIMLSPYRHVPLSVIYAYCIRHCSYYWNNRHLCQRSVDRILASEPCFKRLPQEDNRPDYWTFDMRYKDVLEKELSADISRTASCIPWEHDHGGYHRRSSSEPVEASNTSGRFTESDARLGTGIDGAVNPPLWKGLHGSGADSRHGRGGVRNGDESGTESELRCSPGRPHLQSLTSSLPSLPAEFSVERIHNEEKGEHRQRMVNTRCYRGPSYCKKRHAS